MTKVIYTTHARERISLRRLSTWSIEDAIKNPDKWVDLDDGKRKFIKMQGKRLYHVVAECNERQRAWVVISVWVRGEEDPENFLWQLLVAPFKLAWWLVRLLFGWGK